MSRTSQAVALGKVVALKARYHISNMREVRIFKILETIHFKTLELTVETSISRPHPFQENLEDAPEEIPFTSLLALYCLKQSLRLVVSKNGVVPGFILRSIDLKFADSVLGNSPWQATGRSLRWRFDVC
jgi:hypothetical protein